MKKYILLFLLLSYPLYVCATDQTRLDNQYYISKLLPELNKHKEEALRELGIAYDMCWYIPDLSKKQHLEAIITSSVASLSSRNIKKKILIVGLTALGSVVVDMHNTRREMYYRLAKAEYHFEMINFYQDSVFRLLELGKNFDEGDQILINIIKKLILCDMLVTTAENHFWDIDPLRRLEISNHISHHLQFMKNLFNNDNKKLLYSEMWQKFSTLDDNIGEILSEFWDDDIKDEIFEYIEEIKWNIISLGEDYWDVDLDEYDFY